MFGRSAGGGAASRAGWAARGSAARRTGHRRGRRDRPRSYRVATMECRCTSHGRRPAWNGRPRPARAGFARPYPRHRRPSSSTRRDPAPATRDRNPRTESDEGARVSQAARAGECRVWQCAMRAQVPRAGLTQRRRPGMGRPPEPEVELRRRRHVPRHPRRPAHEDEGSRPGRAPSPSLQALGVESHDHPPMIRDRAPSGSISRESIPPSGSLLLDKDPNRTCA